MADIRPFKAIRPAKGMESRIAALPYDVYSRAEAKVVVGKNPDSFLAIDRAETQFDDSVDTYADCVYEKAAQMLKERIEKGDFVKEDKAVYYLYELTMDGRVQTGIVGCASIDDYEKQVIKKHENTRADKEADRIRHVDTCNAQTGPIFLAYRQTKELRELMLKIKSGEALYDFTSDDGIRHRVFVISGDEDIAVVKKAFDDMNALYIADGHHRCASAVRVGQKRRAANKSHTGNEEYNYFLSVIFPDEELMIMDYNRVVHDLNGNSVEQFMDALKKVFTVSDAMDTEYHPACKGELGMYLDGSWYKLNMLDEVKSDDPVDGLDVAILQDKLLSAVLGIEDPKTDKRIEFVGGIRGLGELKSRVDALPQKGVAFAMYPTSIGELFAVADAGRLMPPKSTWFEPKLRSGIFIHSIEEASNE
ncbi:MAG: DUF1015 domain-containing protein [Lachnospiraceae bacterium]|nr:DUF1015 domain-containing protein [Lachnospiraceae bacterium]